MSMSSATQGQVGPRSLPPFRADHVGSLLRPRELVEARAARKAGTLSAEAVRAVEDRCIEAAIHKQEDAGLRARVADLVRMVRDKLPGGMAEDTSAALDLDSILAEARALALGRSAEA